MGSRERPAVPIQRLAGGGIIEEMSTAIIVVITAAFTATVVSVICCQISFKYMFEMVSAHMDNVIELAKESIRKVYSDQGKGK